MKLNEIFPTPMWEFQLDENLNEISEWILSQHKLDVKGKQKSNFGGWQSRGFDKFSGTPLDSLWEFINSQIPPLCETMGYPLNGRKLSNFWININPKYAYNTTHTHPGSKFSGVFYVNTNENSGNLRLINPMQFQASSDTPTKYTCSEVETVVGNNKLLIFPGWIQHHVLANASDEVRVSVSFNII